MAQAAQAIAGIDALGCGKLAGYLPNRAPGLSLATAALNTQLRELTTAYPEFAVSLSCLVWRLVSACKDRSAYWQRNGNKHLLVGVYAQLQSLLS